MNILVAYASKHGATQAIAERIAETLRSAGHQVEVMPAHAVSDPAGYDAFVIGSAAYFGHWQKEAVEFVQRNRAVLATRPVWLFSSGPLGTGTTNLLGEDLRTAATPTELASLCDAIRPRDHRVFFGALDPSTLGIRDRLIRALPAGHDLLPEGDFRDWHEIEQWAADIVQMLAPLPA